MEQQKTFRSKELIILLVPTATGRSEEPGQGKLGRSNEEEEENESMMILNKGSKMVELEEKPRQNQTRIKVWALQETKTSLRPN